MYYASRGNVTAMTNAQNSIDPDRLAAARRAASRLNEELARNAPRLSAALSADPCAGGRCPDLVAHQEGAHDI